MQITAKLSQKLPLQTGTGRNGEWKKQDIIVETEGQYPKKICISIWGDKINDAMLVPGNMLKIDFDVESREYNSRWYTDVKAWKIELTEGSSDSSSNYSDDSSFSQSSLPEGETKDDLPF
jgi:hypothetical protein